MARKLNPQGLLDQKVYLFQGYAQYKDKVFEEFARTCQANKLPVRLTEEKYKSGGGLLMGASSDMLLTIDGGFKPFAVLGATSYGNFLSVNLYFLVEDSLLNVASSVVHGLRGNLTGLANINKDMISIRDQEAFWNTVVACLEESFNNLKFKEFQGGFLGVK